MSSSATAEAVAPRARTVLEALADGLLLARDGWKELAGAALLGTVPAVLLAALAGAAAGLHDPEMLSMIVVGEEPGRLLLVASATALARLLELFSTLAVLAACDARDRGRPVTALEAWRRALSLAGPFLSAFARVAARVLGGAVLFLVPGLVALARGAYFPHAVAVDGLDGRGAAEKSRRLVSAAPGRLLGGLLASAAAAWLLAYAALFALSLGLASATSLAPAGGGPLERGFIDLLERCLAATVGLWPAAVSVLLYKDSR